MSAIGDYIHYYKRNYRKYGTNLPGTFPSENYNSVISKIKKDISQSNKAQASAANAKKIEDEYNRIFYNKNSDRAAVAFRNELEKKIQESLDKQYSIAAGRFDFDSFTIEETDLQRQLTIAVEKTRESFRITEARKENTVRELLNKTDKLLRLLDSNEFKSIQGIQRELTNARNEINIIRNKMKSQLNFANDSVSFDYSDVQTINKVIQEFNRVPSLYNQNQFLFEWLVPFIGLKIGNIAKEELQEYMEQLIASLNSDSDIVKVEMDIQELIAKKVKLLDIEIPMDHVTIKTTTGRESTDVNITYSDKPNMATPAVRQAKEPSGRDIILLNQESLYSILYFNNKYNFSNHYLNIVTKARKKQRFENDSILEANRILKSLILNNINASSLKDYIVLSNPSKSKVEVYSLETLLYILQDRMLNSRGRYSNIIDLKNSFSIPQKWSKVSKEDRIKNVISSVQKTRVSGRINKGEFKTYLSLLRRYK